MGEAKRRGNYAARVAKAVERTQVTMKTRAAQSQIELQEHLQRLEARRVQMERQMGPLDKLHAQQAQVLRNAADKLKQMEGVQVVAETSEGITVTMASPESLGSVIEGEVLARGETSTLIPVDESPFIPVVADEALTTGSVILDQTLQGGFTPDEMVIFIANPSPVLSPAIDNSHFDDLAPIVSECKNDENSTATISEEAS